MIGTTEHPSEGDKMSLPKNTLDGNSPSQDDFKILSRIKDALTDCSLKASDVRLYAHLMLCSGKLGETTWGHGALARAVHISERQSQRITAKLDQKGYLKSTQRGLKRVNRYVMPWHSEFSEPTPMADQKPLEATSMSFPEPTPAAVPEPTPMAVPIVKEAYVKDLEAKEKHTTQLAGRVLSFDQNQLQSLRSELQALTEAVRQFVADSKLNPQTVKNIWTAAKGKCPDIEVNDLAMWLRMEAHDGRQFATWGGVVNMIRQELEYDPADSGNYEPDYAKAQREPAFTTEDFRQHCNYCASELLKLKSPSFAYDEVARFMLTDGEEYGEYYTENLEECEDRMLHLEQKTVRRALAALSQEDQHEIHFQVNNLLGPYAYKVSVDQKNFMGEQFTRQLIFEKLRLPRFSLFDLNKSNRAAPITEKPWRDMAHLTEEKQGDLLLEEEVNSLPIGPAFEQGFLDESDLDHLESQGKYKPRMVEAHRGYSMAGVA